MKTAKLVMLTLIAGAFLSRACNSESETNGNDYPITPVDFTDVALQDGFWKHWVETAAEATVPYAFRKCEETGRIDNFAFAGGVKEGKFRGDNSDLMIPMFIKLSRAHHMR